MARVAQFVTKSSIGDVIECATCGATFAKRRGLQRFCSERCRRRDESVRQPTVTGRCAWCDKQCQQRAADVGRYRSGPFCDKDCAVAYRVCVLQRNGARRWPRSHPCIDCGVEYPTKANAAKARCPECYQAWAKAQLVEVACIDCGLIEIAHPNRKRCRPCKRRREQRRNGKTKDNRHLKRRTYIIKRDHGRCQVCKCKVKLGDPLHPRAAEIDHIIPRSQGGSDDLVNLRLTHWGCNQKRGNRGGGEQLALVG